MINVGLSEASTALIGNQIGALNVPGAKKYAKVIFCLSSAFGYFISVILYLSRKQITALFTKDENLVKIILSLYLFICFGANIVGSLKVPFLGMVRAIGI
jgi:Na+-driven multidrug efflux pump